MLTHDATDIVRSVVFPYFTRHSIIRQLYLPIAPCKSGFPYTCASFQSNTWVYSPVYSCVDVLNIATLFKTNSTHTGLIFRLSKTAPTNCVCRACVRYVALVVFHNIPIADVLSLRPHAHTRTNLSSRSPSIAPNVPFSRFTPDLVS